VKAGSEGGAEADAEMDTNAPDEALALAMWSQIVSGAAASTPCVAASAAKLPC
jgi:hypothetical protein